MGAVAQTPFGRCATAIKKSPRRLVLALALAAGNCPSDAAANLDVPPDLLSKWESLLRQAGARPIELTNLESLVAKVHGSVVSDVDKELTGSPAAFLHNFRINWRELSAPPASQLYPGVVPTVKCDALRRTDFRGFKIENTTIDDRGSCRIIVYVSHSPQANPITIFVSLPIEKWNGRFFGTGGGGYSGGDAKNVWEPLINGYAVGATDTGNPQGTAAIGLSPSGKPAWENMRENGYLGIHDMTVVGKALTRAFYGRPPRYAYFIGGSTGGRQALTEAERYPRDYDGILALYPAIARDRYVPAKLWPQILMRDHDDFLPPETLAAVTAAAIKACDRDDGVADGIIGDPTRCRYDPAALVGTQINGRPFTRMDASIVLGIWDGPRDHDGVRLWWGPLRGADLTALADAEGDPLIGKPNEEGLDWFRYFLVRDPNWDWKTMTVGVFERLFRDSIKEYSSIYGGDDPNLERFRTSGGKLLIAHGYADQVVPPQETLAYVQDVGRRVGEIRARQFVRLFMVPGADHGFWNRAPSPSTATMLQALIKWVEHGNAPKAILAESVDTDPAAPQSRHIYPYPTHSCLTFN